jgi:hypothetical protein
MPGLFRVRSRRFGGPLDGHWLRRRLYEGSAPAGPAPGGSRSEFAIARLIPSELARDEPEAHHDPQIARVGGMQEQTCYEEAHECDEDALRQHCITTAQPTPPSPGATQRQPKDGPQGAASHDAGLGQGPEEEAV